MKFIQRHPILTACLLLALACYIWGARTVGGALGHTAGDAFHMAQGLVTGLVNVF